MNPRGTRLLFLDEELTWNWAGGEPDLKFVVAGREIPLRLLFLDQKRLVIDLEGRIEAASYRFGHNGSLHLCHRGRHYLFQKPALGAARRALPERGGGEVCSPMSGKVIALFCKEGQEVAEGEELVVVEAMKMEHCLHAHQAGQVVLLPVHVGQSVGVGELLVKLDIGKAEP